MKIVIATGGSGGHILPALYVAKELRRQGHDVSFFGVFGGMADKIANENFVLRELRAKGLNTNSLKSILVASVFMVESIFRSFPWLWKLKPAVVIGFGGYGAFPVVLAAVCLRIPTLIHEQNVIPGRANALLGRLVRKVAVSFKEGERYFSPSKTVLTGCPCHPPDGKFWKDQVAQGFKLDKDKYTILVLGGSQGSRSLNRVFLEAVPLLLAGKKDFQVVHICGSKDFAYVKQQYGQLNVTTRVFAFLDDIPKAFAISNLVLTRAGAVTVTEILAFTLPAIIVPYPHAAGHQKQNAALLQDCPAIEVIDEKDLTKERLADTVQGFFHHHPEVLKDAIGKLRTKLYRPNAPADIAREAVGLTRT